MASTVVAGRSSSRPNTPRDTGLVKTIRYEEASTGTPPMPITSPTAVLNKQSSTLRPRTAPSSSTHRTSHFSEDVKRDSGFSTSPPSQSYITASNAPPTPKLPSYVSKEEKAPVLNGTAPEKRRSGAVTSENYNSEDRRPRTSFGRRRSKKGRQQRPRSVSPSPLRPLESFKGIETDIPTGDLGDLTTDNFGFSNRGSIMFGGRKMNELFAAISNGDADFEKADHDKPVVVATDHEPALSGGLSSKPLVPAVGPPSAEETKRIPEIITTDTGAADVASSTVDTPDAPRKGLVTGRRKPSVHMLQAALAGGRVLSAEEITFSMKVRSMYEAGDETAADWTAGSGSVSREASEALSESTLDAADDLAEKNSENHKKNGSSRRSQDIRASYYTKGANELAGGIEDWQDVKGGEVDRYGFIVPRTDGDRPLSVGADNMHRVATGLRLAADQPRRRGLRRSPSNARSSRSLPPRPGMRPSSLHSSASATGLVKPRRSVFRTKDRRITDAAGDMLTLPPGLADIAEDQDDAQLRRREWARNEKWQKMARPMGDSLRTGGGGAQFWFDTTDPKVISRTWKGIPDRWRATAWHSFLTASAKRRGRHASDETLIEEFRRVQDLNCADDYQIDVDVPRTINMHVMFRRRYRGGQRLLFRVLHAISLYFPDTGYVQGMASLAATLLCYFDEERAFVMMVRMWQLRGLEQLFKAGFDGLMAALKELEDHWLAGSDVAQQLDELSITSTAYGTRWYLTLFNMSIPFPAQLRVWDVFMLLGDATPNGSGSFGGADLDVLHATSAALIDATREIILDSDFENAMKVLTSFVPIRDEDLLMRVTRTEWKMAKKRSGAPAG